MAYILKKYILGTKQIEGKKKANPICSKLNVTGNLRVAYDTKDNEQRTIMEWKKRRGAMAKSYLI